MTETIVLILLCLAWVIGEYALMRAISTPSRYILALRMGIALVIGFQVLRTLG